VPYARYRDLPVLQVDRSVEAAARSGQEHYRICMDELEYVVGIGEMLALMDDEGWRVEGVIVWIEVDADLQEARFMLLEALPMPGTDQIAALQGVLDEETGLWTPCDE